jgi:uncharacterized repeat protein (TIGR01451 family)
MQKLNNRGIGHLLALAVIVLGFSTYGTFKLVATKSTLPPVESALKVDSVMRKSGQSEYAKTLQIKSGDSVEFKTTVRNQSNEILFNVNYKNVIPKGLLASNGSLSIDGTPVNSLLTKTNLNSIIPSGTKTVTFSALVVADSDACEKKKLTNVTTVTAKNAKAQQNKLVMNVCPGGSIVSQQPAPKPKSELSLDYGIIRTSDVKGGRTGEVITQPKETLQFMAVVKNTGQVEVKKSSVRFIGINPRGLNVVKGSITVDGKTSPYNSRNGINLGTLPVGATRTITVDAITGDASLRTCGTKKLTTKVQLLGAGLKSQSKNASVQICKTTEPRG